MTDPTARTFSSDFKRFFLRGLVVLLPSVLTLWIVVKAYQFVDTAIAEPINQGVRLGMGHLAPYWKPLRTAFDPAEAELVQAMAAAGSKAAPREEMIARLRSQNIQEWWHDRWYMDLIGLVVAVVSVYVAGRLLGGYLGRSVYRRIERMIISVPILKQVYPSVKQIVDFLLGNQEQPLKFSRVVMVEYPRRGSWSIGFLTGRAMQAISDTAGDSVTVFVPSSPTPFTGYAVSFPRSEVVEMPLSVEEAVRFIVSCGVLSPDSQRPYGLPEVPGPPFPAVEPPKAAEGQGPPTPGARRAG